MNNKISNDILISKTLSYKLRHDDTIVRDSEGYVHISKLDMDDIPFTTIKRIVDTNNKSRFSLIEREDGYYIRANQGHSKNIGDSIDTNIMMTRIDNPINRVYHGTYVKYLDKIKMEGLNRMSRKHIHIAKSIDAKSGKRNDCNVTIYIDMKKAMEDGIVFYESSNNVILTEGIDGTLDPKYFNTIIINH